MAPEGDMRLPTLQQMDEVRAGGLLFDQFVAGLPRKRLEVAQRAGVGGNHAQQVAAGHVGQRLLGLQDRQRAIQSAGVEFDRFVHGRQFYERDAKSMKTGSWPRERSQSASA
jgi:hypothetical protein